MQAGSLSQESFDRNEKLFILSATAVLFPTLTSRNVCCENTWSSPTIFHWGGGLLDYVYRINTLLKQLLHHLKGWRGWADPLLASEHPQTTSIKIMSNWHYICKDLDEAELWHHRGWWKRENRGSTCFKKIDLSHILFTIFCSVESYTCSMSLFMSLFKKFDIIKIFFTSSLWY